jgi:hypothetical protein
LPGVGRAGGEAASRRLRGRRHEPIIATVGAIGSGGAG